MLTEKCKVIIDEAITAGGDLSKLSPEAAAHFETCIECRRSLESIKALKASSASVLPTASLALKSKIAAKLEGTMQARQAANTVTSATKTPLKTGVLIACLGLSGILTLGLFLSNSKGETDNNSSIKANNQTSQSLASDSANVDSATSSLKIYNNGTTGSDKLLRKGNTNEDLRSHEPIKYPTQNVPSAKKDSDI